MAMTAGSGPGGMKSDIDVTLLVDVVLVLLIIFMLVTPMMQRGLAMNLPKSAHSIRDEKAEPLVPSSTVDQRLFVEHGYYSDAAGFRTRLERELRSQPARHVRLKADDAMRGRARDLPRTPTSRSSSLPKERVP